MKNKLFRKMISCLVTAVLTLGLFTGCSNAKEESKESSSSNSGAAEAGQPQSSEVSEAAEVTYPIDTDVTLTIAMPTSSSISAYYTDISETPRFEEWEKQTGVNVEIMQMEKDALKLLLVSDDMPDIVWGITDYLSGSTEAAVEDGIIEPLTDYIDEYMPDYKAALEKYDLLKKSMTTPSGDIFGAGIVYEEENPPVVGRGIFLRQDWLEELNLEVPETMEEFYNVAVAFKEEKGAYIGGGLGGFMGGFMNGQITDAFGLVKGSLYQVDGVVHYGWAEQEVKEVFAFINKLYSEGLIDPEIVTIDSNSVRNKVAESKIGIISGYATNTDSYKNMVLGVDPDSSVEFVGIPYLVQEKGTVARGGDTAGQVSEYFMFITTDCEHPEIAAQLLNYGYTEAGSVLMNYGIEGTSYEMENDAPALIADTFTNLPEGMTAISTLQASYIRIAEVRWPGIIASDAIEQYRDKTMTETRKVTEERWAQNTWSDYCIPSFASVFMTIEEADEYSKISGEVATYVKEMLAAYMTGAKSLDTFETEYLATLESLGVDRMIEIYQSALDQFNAN